MINDSNNLLTLKDDSSVVSAFEYNTNNLLTQTTTYREGEPDALLTKTETEYDDQGCVTKTIQAVDVGTAEEDTIISETTYDPNGNVIKQTTPAGIVEINYDANGRMTSNSDILENWTHYGYDDVDNRLISLNYPGIGKIEYECDALGRRTALTTTTGSLGSERTKRVNYSVNGHFEVTPLRTIK
ncbi:uncharacterized protein SCALIN_C05_0027 [Candidatus Scalindua japonica]|uniref:Rhs family protein n=1 Tax=Candidatus Scalindua japonica TaxID=1284222 RepID=A0A286TVN9_9BACT|nr:hypothetical protein [Candidatus Scalindua japonica]GAX59942.1 uncharacterized protein SCALIN_C05_0027 [Candidatus Scalindua japonica]